MLYVKHGLNMIINICSSSTQNIKMLIYNENIIISLKIIIFIDKVFHFQTWVYFNKTEKLTSWFIKEKLSVIYGNWCMFINIWSIWVARKHFCIIRTLGRKYKMYVLPTGNRDFELHSQLPFHCIKKWLYGDPVPARLWQMLETFFILLFFGKHFSYVYSGYIKDQGCLSERSSHPYLTIWWMLYSNAYILLHNVMLTSPFYLAWDLFTSQKSVF